MSKKGKNVSAKINSNPSNQLQGFLHQQHISVPMHHPEILKQFAEIDPTYPERILQMAEKQHEHRITLETRQMDANVEQMRKIAQETHFGQLLAFLCYITGIIAGCWFIYKGQSLMGTLLSGSSVAAVVYSFIQGKKK